MSEFKTIVIAGSGGNFILRDFIGFYVGHLYPEINIKLIDGGAYKVRHYDHESYSRLGNKAIVSKEMMLEENPKLKIRAYPFYIGNERSKLSKLPEDLIQDGDIILLCVDNSATIKLVSEYCEKLNNVILISGGIDKEDVDVQIFLKIDGKNVFPPFHSYLPHVKNPKDELPTETIRRGCIDGAGKERPNIFSLMMCDALSLCTFFAILEHLRNGTIEDFDIREIFFNVLKLKMRTIPKNII